MTDLASRVSYRLVTPSELAQVFKLETLAFSPDEAATESKLALRLSEANDLFLGLYLASAAATAAEPELIGFICATLSPTSTLSHDSMSTHDPAAAYIAIHSVCVTPTYQRRGLASQLLAKYVEWVRKLNQQRRGGIKGIRLIAHDYLIGFYERGGFVNRGKSQVVHGEGEWFEIGLDFDNAVEEEREESVRSPGARFETKPMSEWVDESGTNKVDIFCPRGECRCLLLRKGVGRWVQNDGQFKVSALFIAYQTVHRSDQGMENEPAAGIISFDRLPSCIDDFVDFISRVLVCRLTTRL